jgi:hypothetical protein
MKYETECFINLPLEEVIAIFEDSSRLIHWQRGIESTQLIKGIDGEVGSKRRLKIEFEGQRISMIETITHKDLPHEWHGRYTSKGLESIQQNYFSSTEANQTKWISKSSFGFSGWMILISKVLPGIFKKRSELVMSDFKNYAEKGISVAGLK